MEWESNQISNRALGSYSRHEAKHWKWGEGREILGNLIGERTALGKCTQWRRHNALHLHAHRAGLRTSRVLSEMSQSPEAAWLKQRPPTLKPEQSSQAISGADPWEWNASMLISCKISPFANSVFAKHLVPVCTAGREEWPLIFNVLGWMFCISQSCHHAADILLLNPHEFPFSWCEQIEICVPVICKMCRATERSFWLG